MRIDGFETMVLETGTGTQTLPSDRGDIDIDIRSVLLRLHTDEGLVGLGESFHHSATIEDSLALARSVEALVDDLMGRDPRNVRALWYDRYERAKRGATYDALGVIDQALWDVLGKAAGEPLYRLLGGATGDLATYATFPHAKDVEKLVEDASWLADYGFPLIKIVAGFGVDPDRERIRRLAEATPEAIDVAIDANTTYGFTDALAVAETAADYGIRWFEEPIAHTDIEGIADLRRQVSVPIAGYQTHSPHYPAVHHLRAGAYDIYQPSVYHGGGVTAATNVATLVEAFNKDLVPHAIGPAVTFAASLHVAAAAPACSLVEFAVFDDEASDPREFIASPYVANQSDLSVGEDGSISPPDQPGIGVELDLDALDTHRIDN